MRTSRPDCGRRRDGTRAVAAVGALLVLATACYLPRAETAERPLENQVLVAVYRCSAEVVSGEIINSNDVDISVLIVPRWQDAQRNTFHEVEIEAISVPADSTVEWKAMAAAEIERPQFCETETVSIDEA